MGRTIIAEENLREKIESLHGTPKWQIGLIIGQLSTQKDFVVHLAKTPDPVEDEAEIETCEDESNMPVKQDDKKHKKSIKMSLSEDIDEQWVIEHARQVNKMLPGGLNIIGVFVFCSPEFARKNQSKLFKCVAGVHKVTEKGRFQKSWTAHSERILVHVCSSTRKIISRTVNVLDSVMALQPAELKFQSFIGKWNTVQCVSNIDVQFHLPVSSEKSRLEVQILHGLQWYLERIWDGVAAMNGKIINEDEILCEQTKSSKGKTVKDKPKVFDVELFTSPNSKKNGTTKQQNSFGIISFVGKLFCQAHLHAKATKGEAIKALKCDIIRNILSRLQLLCEEAEVNNLYQVENWSLVSPIRVFVPISKSPTTFCDYIFKDERNEDSLQRLSELLGISAVEEDLVFVDKSPDPEMAVQMTSGSAYNSSAEETEPFAHNSTSAPKKNTIIFFSAIILAILAVLIGLFFLK